MWSACVRLGYIPFYFVLACSEAGTQALPETDARVTISAQESSWEPGPRTIDAGVYYPQGRRDAVMPDTGLFLTLHNWGGTGAIGTADPEVLVERYNVVAITVDYYQSGKFDSAGPLPYDFGWLQALDALRALHFVWSGLDKAGIAFNKGRIFATGGSGGGNVSLMANKLAPRTFACIVDMCGMAKLNDDIAYGLEGGSYLNANYSRDTGSPRYLAPRMQELRFVGHPEHLKTMQALGHTATVVVVHGETDEVCPTADKREMVANMGHAGLRVDAHFIGDQHLDGEAFRSTGHSLGNRTLILQRVADPYLLPDSADRCERIGPSDFERRETVRYATPEGSVEIDFAAGYPVGRSIPSGKE